MKKNRPIPRKEGFAYIFGLQIIYNRFQHKTYIILISIIMCLLIKLFFISMYENILSVCFFPDVCVRQIASQTNRQLRKQFQIHFAWSVQAKRICRPAKPFCLGKTVLPNTSILAVTYIIHWFTQLLLFSYWSGVRGRSDADVR